MVEGVCRSLVGYAPGCWFLREIGSLFFGVCYHDTDGGKVRAIVTYSFA